MQSLLAGGRNHKLVASFVSHHNDKFERIRHLDCITTKDLMESFSIELNMMKQFKIHVTEASNNSSFYFRSIDDRFLIKSISNSEKHKLFSMLDDLIAHFEGSANISLLARIYGVFTMSTNMFGTMTLVIMQNISNMTD